MKYLMICEKPSLMRDVRSCYNNHKSEVISNVGEIDFIVLAGHICTNYEPNDYDEWSGSWYDVVYPMIPTKWGIKLIQNDNNIKIIKQIKETIDDYDGLIVATDSDVEGFGIYYLLEQYLGIEDREALRFMEHSLTDEEILHSLLTMTDFHTDAAHQRFVKSFIIRSRTDWLFGMNATRMVTTRLHSSKPIKIGRVMSVAIKIVYDNSMEIENFKAKNYYILEADYGTFTAVLTEDNKNPKKFDSEDEIPNVPKKGTVLKKEVSKTSTHAPKLYDLTAIQTEAGQSFGYKPDETLAIIQSLYETHKVISYPRTQCRYVSSEKAKEFKSMLEKMSVFDDLKDIAAKITDEDIARVMLDKQVVNDAEVQKESHDALLPTSNTPDLSKMNQKEINICNFIYKRLLAQFLPSLVENKTNLIIRHGEENFVAKGKIVLEQGWRVLYSELKDNIIPDVEKGDEIEAEEFKKTKKTTKPPKRLTQATLVYAMEHIDTIIKDKELKKSMAESKGIGTPATRAGIIAKIISSGYVMEDKKGGLFITDFGKKYVDNVKHLDIMSPVFAAILDTDMKKIQRGEALYEDIYKKVLENLKEMVAQISALEEQIETVDVECPKCEETLKVGRFTYKCPTCGLDVPKQICGVDITENMLELILSGQKTDMYKFKKKDGNTFTARLQWDTEEEDVKFDFTSDIVCPLCEKEGVNLNSGGAFCDCGLKLFRKIGGKELSDSELKGLIKYKKITDVKGFKKKDGSEFTANIKINDEKTLELYWDASSNELYKCPLCGKESVKINNGGAFCDCGLKVFKKYAGYEFSTAQLTRLIKNKKLTNINGFKKKDGTEFGGNVRLKEDGLLELYWD